MKKIVIALAVLALLAGYYYFFEIKKKEDTIEKKAKEEAIFHGVSKEDIVSIKIKNTNGVMEMEKKDGQWVILKPINTYALIFPVEALINSWIEKTPERVIQGEPLSEYGISPEGFYCEMQTAAGEKLKLFFGNSSVTNAHIYAQKENEPDRVYMFDSEIYRNIEREVKDYRYTGMVVLKPEDVYEIEIAMKEKKYMLKREGALWVVSGSGKYAKTERVNQIISNYTGRAVKEFIKSTDYASYNLASKKEKAVFRVKGGDKTIYLASKGKEADAKYYALSRDFPGEILEIEQYAYNYPPAVEELENKQVVIFTEAEIEKVEVRQGGKMWSAKRGKDADGNPKWVNYDIKGYTGAEKKKLNPDSMLSSLFWAEHKGSFKEPDRAVSVEAYKISEDRQIKMYAKDGSLIGHISVGAAIDGNEEAYFRNEADSMIYRMEKSLLERMGF